MPQIKLIVPTLDYARAIMDFRQEFMDSNDSMDGSSNLQAFTSAEAWIHSVRMHENEATCPEGKVPSNTYLAIRDGDHRLVGIIDFRHHIDHPVLKVWGGHIGYSVRPSERGKGYAKEMLRQSLVHCKQHGLKKVLVTCDSDNIASKRTILANGGILEKEIAVDNNRMERYWIPLQSDS